MQSLYPLSSTEFNDKAKQPVSQLEIFIECCPFDLCNFYGKNYMIEAHYSAGQQRTSYKPVAAQITAVIDNTDGLFHPKNTESPFNSYIKVGRKMIFSTGFKIDGLDYLWQWFEGVISNVRINTEERQIVITGLDYMEYLTEVELKSPDNYWGTSVTKSTVALQSVYSMPDACNGAYIAYLDGSPIYDEKQWVYDRDNNEFVFLPDYIPGDGVDNLIIYYYTDQVPENVIADLLVTAGLYPDQAAALANMEYEATGKTIERVRFTRARRFWMPFRKSANG